MSIKLIQQAWESQLRGNDLLVLIALADNASDEGYCWPSWQSIMAKTKVSRGTLSSVLNRLEKDGYIVRESRKRGSGSNASNGYFILQNKQSSRFEHHQNKGQSSESEHKSEGVRSSEFELGGVQNLNPQSSESEHLYEPSYNRQFEPSYNPLPPKGELDIPASVNSIALDEWFKYKGAKYSKQGKALSINFLAKYDSETQYEIVQTSIMNGWKGLFEPKAKQAQHQKPKSMGEKVDEVFKKYYGGNVIDGEIAE